MYEHDGRTSLLTYCCSRLLGGFEKLLENNKIGISTTENGNPLENAIAERVNSKTKIEYLTDYQAENLNDTHWRAFVQNSSACPRRVPT